MGAFYLYDTSKAIDTDAVHTVFKKKGFEDFRDFKIGNYRLLLYKKQLVDADNHLEKDGCEIYTVGTYAYKGLGYKASQAALLDDCSRSNIDYNELIGNYVIVFNIDGKLKVLTDPLNLIQVFSDSGEEYLTTSFLAALVSKKQRHRINRQVFYEKFSVGYLVGDGTYMEDVFCVTDERKRKSETFEFIGMQPPITDTVFDRDGRTKSINGQIKSLDKIFSSIKALSDEFGADLGLSGGYDSRLVFAMMEKHGFKDFSLHSHSTEGVKSHAVEREIASQIAKAFKVPHRIVETKQLNMYDEQKIESILTDGIYYFDGRCSYDMGAFSCVYTNDYKRAVANENKVVFNGNGGEIFRNDLHTLNVKTNFNKWMDERVFYNKPYELFSEKNTADNLRESLKSKYEQRLGIRINERENAFFARRYYGEVRMSDNDGLNCTANNQMSFYVTPFMERSVIKSAYRGFPYLGIYGEYEAGIVRSVCPKVAEFITNHGYTLMREPFKYKFRYFVSSVMPKTKTFIMQLIRGNSVKLSNKSRAYFDAVYDKSEFLRKADEYMCALFPEVNFDAMKNDSMYMPTYAYVATTMYEFRDYIAI